MASITTTPSRGGGLKLLLENYSDSDSLDEGTDGDNDHNGPADANDDQRCVENTPARPAVGEPRSKGRLPMPVDVQSMFSDKTDTTNNNTSETHGHGGRFRSFGHVRGNWASFMFLPFSPKSKSLHAMVEIIQTSLDEFPDQPQVTINDEFHLSLSRTIVLHHHWIEPFIQSLKKAFRMQKRFNVIFTEFKVYLNDEKTRTFVGMNIFASETLLGLIRDCDTCLQEYGLEKYYQNASFHVSIAWCVGNHDKWMRTQLLPLLNSKWANALDNDSSLQMSTINEIELKTGNKSYQFRLEET